MKERLVPYDLDAEMAVIGSILLDPAVYDTVVEIVSPADFYREAHRLIFEAMMHLATQGTPADVVTLSNELQRTEKLDQVGGLVGLMNYINEIPTSAHAAHYARLVAKTAEQRRLIHAAGQIAALAYEQDDESVAKAEQLLFQVRHAARSGSGFESMSQIMDDYVQELEFLHEHKGALTGVPTGFTDIDSMLGGLQRSDMVILAARPSMGKTALALCMGYNAALRGQHVAVFSLEMGKKLLRRRLMAMDTKVDMQRLRMGWVEDDDWEKIIDSVGNLSRLPIWINDTAGNPISSMRSSLRRLVQEHGQVDLAIVDYIGLVEPEADTGKREQNQVQLISAISRGIKNLAREFDIPILALCQLSRAVESRQNKRPMLSDLRDSGSLEQDADVVMFIYRDDYYGPLDASGEYEPNNIAEVHIAKHRNGPTGAVSLFFHKQQTMFYNLEHAIGGEQ